MKYFVQSKSLRNSELEPLTIYFNIRDNAIGKQWTDALIKNIVGNDSLIPKTHPLDKIDNYMSDIEFLCQRFNHGIKQINKHIDGYEHIDIQLDPTNINQDKLNQAHHHFEKLIGQKWNVSKWFDNASESGKWAIMELNSSIHNIEINKKDTLFAMHTYNCRDWINNSWPSHNQFDVLEANKITYDSYKCYQKTQPWGSVILGYAQTGKPHYDAFEDKDEYVNRDNISGWRYVTGEVFLLFIWPSDIVEQYEKWLVENGFDLNDITECYYGLIVADIDKEYIIPRYGNNEMEVHDVILQYDDVIKIGLADDNYKEVMSRDYSWYTWKDQYEAYKKHFV